MRSTSMIASAGSCARPAAVRIASGRCCLVEAICPALVRGEDTWSMVIAGVDPDPASAGRIREWTVDYWEALHPYSMGGAYLNFMMDEGQERVRATYGDNYDRLARVKAANDPD